MSAMPGFRSLALAGAAALALGASTLAGATSAQAQPWGWGPGWGGPPPHVYGGPRWRHDRGYRPHRVWGERCVTRPRWVDGPWGPRRVLVRRCW